MPIAVTGIVDALELLDGGLLDLADHGAERDVALQPDAGLDDRLDCDQRRRKPALHVVGAETEDPTVAQRRLGPESVAREMLLGAGIGRVHVTGEQQIEAVAAPAQMTDRIRSPLIDQRQVGLQAEPVHAVREIARDLDLVAGRAWNVHEVDQEVADGIGRDVSGSTGEIGMGHSGHFLTGRGDRASLLRGLDDRVVTGGIESDQVPRLLHMRRQRRRDVDHAAARMRHHYSSRQQVQSVLYSAGKFPVFLKKILGVAHDGWPIWFMWARS